MEYAFRVQKDNLDEAIKYAVKYSNADGNQAWLTFGEHKLVLSLEDDAIVARGHWGSTYVSLSEFTSEMLIAILEAKPDLATKELLLEVVKAFVGDDKSKD